MSRSQRGQSGQGSRASINKARRTARQAPTQSDLGGYVRRHQVLLAAVVLTAVGAACYANSFGGAFIFDDLNVIVNTIKPGSLWPPDKLGMFLIGGMRPVVNATLAFNYLCSQSGETWQYHAFNLAVHLAAGLTLFSVLRRMLLSWRMRERFGSAATPLALAASAIWLAHPLATQAVTYIVQRAESMMAMFYLLALYCLLRGAGASACREGRKGRGEEGSADDRGVASPPLVLLSSPPPFLPSSRPNFWYVLAVIACALGMGTKQVMVTAPLVVLLYDRIFLARRWSDLRPRAWMYVAMAATWAILVALVWSSPADTSAGFGTKTVTWWEYAASQPGVIVRYLQLVVWPSGQCLDYGWPIARGFWRIVPAAVLVAALLAATGVALWKRPAVGFAGAAFFLVLAPTSSILPIADLIFEHRMYLPLAAVVALVVFGLYAAAGSRVVQTLMHTNENHAAAWRWGAWSAAGVVVVALGCLTHLRNRIYASELTAWGDVVSRAPDNARAQFNYGNSLGREKRYAEAIEAYHRGMASKVDFPGYKPSRADFLNNEGRALMDTDDPAQLDRAIALLREAIATQPPDRPPSGRYYCNLGKALWSQGKNDDAMAAYRDAARVEPNNPEAHSSIGSVLLQQGKPQEAIPYEIRALELKPDHVEAAYTLGKCFAATGQIDRAAGFFRDLLKKAPQLAPAHFHLAGALAARGEAAAADRHFRLAIQYAGDKPDPLVFNNFAWFLATDSRISQSHPGEAVAMAQKACQISEGKAWSFLDTLAAAYAHDGRWDDAVVTAEKAARLADEAKAPEATDVRARMEMYKSHRAFVQTSRPAPAQPSLDNLR